MTIQQIRYQNLMILLSESGDNQAELARRAGTNAAYISQIVNRTLLPSGKPRSVGTKLARALEAAFGKSKGWMDTSKMGPGIAEPPASYTQESTALRRQAIKALADVAESKLGEALKFLESLSKEK